VDKVSNDVFFKLPLKINNVVRYSELYGYTTSIGEVVKCAARAEFILAVHLVVELHGQPNNIVSIVGE
jgi:hypothetical protein